MSSGRGAGACRGRAAVAVTLALASCGVPPPRTPTFSALAALQSLADSGVDLPRPRLRPGVDTNAATAYYALGRLAYLTMKLDTAELPLYWASRLDPALPEPLFARAVVILRALRHDVFETWLRTRSVGAAKGADLTPRQVQLVDSLQRIAWARNPSCSPANSLRWPRAAQETRREPA